LYAVTGVQTCALPIYPGVVGTSETAAGVHGISTSGPGVLAVSDDVGVGAFSTQGTAVQAQATSGTGLEATSTSGLGATFQGGRAAIRLVPTSTSGHPATGHHQRGEIVVDHKGRVWVCTAIGTPGTWKQLAFV